MRKRLTALIKTEFFKNVATLMTGTTIAQIIALAIYPILTRIYTEGQFGVFTLYMSIISITGIISTGRYQMAILMPREEKKAINLVALGAGVGLIISLILLLTVIFFGEGIGVLFKNKEIVKWLWFVPLSTFLIALFQVSIYWFNRNKNFRQTAAANLSQSIANSGVKLSTARAINSGGGLISGAIIGQVMGATWFIIQWMRKYRSHFRSISLKEMKIVAKEYYRFPGFNLPNNLINNLSNSLPVFLISSYFSAQQLGLYGLGFAMIFRPMNLVVNSMEQVFSQRVIKKYNDNLPIGHDIRTLLKRSIQFGIIPFALAGIFGPFIFRVIFGPEWEESGRYMQILVPWLFSALLANQLTFIPDLFSKQKIAFILNVTRLIMRIVGMAIGIYLENIYIMLGLFSLASLLLVIATLIWYLFMIRKHDNLLKEQPGNAT